MPATRRLVFSRRIMLIPALCLLLIALLVGGLFALSLSARRPPSLGVRNGRLSGCPETPNCVSTQASGQTHWIAPVTFEGSPEDAMDQIVEILKTMPNTRIVTENERYVHAECRSSFFQFVDDVEFLVEPESARIHFRSASRVGYHDMGVNRKRMEAFRKRFHAAAGARTASLPSR